MSEIDSDFLNRVVEVVKSAGEFIRVQRSIFSTDRIEYKGKNDLVSYVDKESEMMLVDQLGSLLPDSGFIAEEGTSAKVSDRYNWIIDPLDGTTNFIHGLPAFSVSVALQEFDEIVLGVVYEINLDECFYALKNHGAYCNEETISVSQQQNFSDALIGTGFPYYEFDRMDSYIEILIALMRNTHGVRRIGSAAVDLAYVAIGRFEGFFEFNLNAWDVAAGAIIVQEAGGTVTDFSGKAGLNFIHNREIIAAGPSYPDLLKTVQSHWF